MNKTACTIIAVILYIIVTCQLSLARERIFIPNDVFYYQPAASVFGAEAVWVNPAALNRFNILSFQFMAEEQNGKYGKSWGTVAQRRQLSFAYRKIDNPSGVDFKEYIFATAFPVGRQMDFGTSYRWFKEGPGIYNKRHFWNIGLTGDYSNAIRWGAVLSNLNRGKIDGVQSETEQRYSLSYRPVRSKITISADMFLSTGTKIRNAEYVYHGEFIPRPGLFINAQIDNNKNFQIGLRVNLQRYFVGSKSRFNRSGNSRGTTAFVGASSIRQPSLISYKSRRLIVSMSGRPSENPPQPFFGTKRTSFLHHLMTIHRAAKDPGIKELRLNLSRTTLGFGQAQELRQALIYFRSHDKKVTCFLKAPNNISYYIASAADKIVIPPVSQLRLIGLRAELTFYAGTLGKLGIDIDLVRIGKYKTAAEQFTRSASTDENREQINRLLDNLYDQFVSDIAIGRGLTSDSVRAIIDNGPFTSDEAMKYGLVDGLSYGDDDNSLLASDFAEVSFRRYRADTLMNDDWQIKPVIAIVVAEGEISQGKGVTPSSMKSAFNEVDRDKYTRAIVLRLNSPGGSALAGEEIHRIVELSSKKRPVVVSMGNVAASGAYYIATPAERMFASPATITGSIGIFGGKLDMSRFNEKIGLGKELYTRGNFAGMMSSIRPFSEEEREKYLSHLQSFYTHFVSLVSSSRKLSTDSVDNIGGGRVWTGDEALANGLVDEMGGLIQSIDYAAKKAGLRDYRVEIYPKKRPLFILPGWNMVRSVARTFGFGGNDDDSGSSLLGFSESDNLFTRLPYDIVIE